jgi:hypothetical protein
LTLLRLKPDEIYCRNLRAASPRSACDGGGCADQRTNPPPLSVTVNCRLQNMATSNDDLSGQIALQAEGGEMEFRKIEPSPIETEGK